jgi:methionyl aminopeptidase
MTESALPPESNPAEAPAPVRKRGPNEQCWCGSGLKYKRCHQTKDAASARQREPAAASRGLTPGNVSPTREVPPSIPRPDYARTGRPGPAVPVDLTDLGRRQRMREACRAAAIVLEETSRAIRPGVTTDELDRIAHELCIKLGGYPSPLNYRGFPKSLCTSVNEVICHGIPDDRRLEEGDIVNLDVTIFLQGMHGDTNATFPVGEVDPASRRLIEVARTSLERGIGAVRPGGKVCDIGRAIEAYVREQKCSVVREYCGHGIGEIFHTSLQIPHYFDPRATKVLEPGMTFTIEPMINLGDWRSRTWPDGWTAVTADGSRSAQFEHTVLVTDDGVEVLTRSPS